MIQRYSPFLRRRMLILLAGNVIWLVVILMLVGDLTPGPALAHKASAEAEVAVDALCGKAAAFEPAAIPAVVFTEPEVACAGLGLDAARAQGIDAVASRFPLTASGRAASSRSSPSSPLAAVWQLNPCRSR